MQKKDSLPPANEIPLRDREDAMGAYLMMFAAVGAGIPVPAVNLIASFIYYYLYKDANKFVAFHAYQSLISQVPLTLINGTGVIWLIRVLFFSSPLSNYFIAFIALLVVSNVFYLVFSIVAAMKAKKGEFFLFIFFGDLALKKYFNPLN